MDGAAERSGDEPPDRLGRGPTHVGSVNDADERVRGKVGRGDPPVLYVNFVNSVVYGLLVVPRRRVTSSWRLELSLYG